MNLTALVSSPTLKRWAGMVSDAWHSFRPGWHWEKADKLRCPKVWQFEQDCLQLGDEDWFLAMRLQPTGWQMSLIRDGKLIGSSFSGQFKVLFGVWSKLWASQLMFSRLQWERTFGWTPGKHMVIRARLDMSRFDDWRERIAARNASWYALREKWEAPPKVITVNTPNGTRLLHADKYPHRFHPFLSHPPQYDHVLVTKENSPVTKAWISETLGQPWTEEAVGDRKDRLRGRTSEVREL